MKKIVAIVLFILLLASPAIAGKSIGNTESGLITTGHGYLTGLKITTDGTNTVTFGFYDNTAAAGTALISNYVATTSASNREAYIKFEPEECQYFTGIYIVATTEGTVTFDVFFKEK